MVPPEQILDRSELVFQMDIEIFGLYACEIFVSPVTVANCKHTIAEQAVE